MGDVQRLRRLPALIRGSNPDLVQRAYRSAWDAKIDSQVRVAAALFSDDIVDAVTGSEPDGALALDDAATEDDESMDSDDHNDHDMDTDMGVDASGEPLG